MTTDQIKIADAHVGDSDGSPETAVAADRAANEARQIIAKARYEGFRMVTDARNDADAILDEAKAGAAELLSASEANDAIAGENADLTAVNAALRVEYNELVDLVNESQDLIERLDTRLLDLATMPDTVTSSDKERSGEVSADATSTVPAFVFDYSPSVAPAPKPSRTKTTSRAESFYTRKSAKLPRIGREGGKDALDAVKAMRDRMREQDSN
jgi:hypothetical protein